MNNDPDDAMNHFDPYEHQEPLIGQERYQATIPDFCKSGIPRDRQAFQIIYKSKPRGRVPKDANHNPKLWDCFQGQWYESPVGYRRVAREKRRLDIGHDTSHETRSKRTSKPTSEAARSKRTSKPTSTFSPTDAAAEQADKAAIEKAKRASLASCGKCDVDETVQHDIVAGSRVLVRYHANEGKLIWHPGEILHVDVPNKTVDISYDDGDNETAVKWQHVVNCPGAARLESFRSRRAASDEAQSIRQSLA